MLTERSTDETLEIYCRQFERVRPKQRNIESVAKWLEGNKPLTMAESSFLNDWDDLIAPSDQNDQGGLDVVVAEIGALLHRWGLPMVRNLS